MHKTTRERIDFLVKIVYAAVVVLLCYIGLRLAGLIWPFLLALVLVACISPLVRFVHSKLKINQKLMSVILLIALYAGVGFLLFFICARAIFWLQDLFSQLPGYYNNTLKPALDNATAWLENWMSNIPAEQMQDIESISESFSSALTNLIGSISDWGIGFVADLISGIPNLLISIVFAILMSFFISLQYNKVTAFLKAQLPKKAADKISELKNLSKNTILKYIRALLILMLCTFVELSIGFFILGVDNPLGKAAGIAIFDALPVFGTGGIMIPWVIMELLQGNFSFAIGLGILYIIVTVIRNIIEPKVVGDQLGLNPVVSLVSIYLGYRLLGVMGMILFPIIAQILITLHHNGTIRLYKDWRVGGKIEAERIKKDAP